MMLFVDLNGDYENYKKQSICPKSETFKNFTKN